MSDSARLRRPMQVSAGLIVSSLVDHDFVGIERLTDGRYLTAAELERAVMLMGGTLINPPAFSYDQLTFIQVADIDAPTFETSVGLWTAERGRTKTALILRFHEWDGIHNVVQPQVIGLTLAEI